MRATAISKRRDRHQARHVAGRIVVLLLPLTLSEHPVRSTSPEEIVSLITGELGDHPASAQEVPVQRSV